MGPQGLPCPQAQLKALIPAPCPMLLRGPQGQEGLGRHGKGQLEERALTEEGLQADHAGHEAVKVEAKRVAGIPGGNGLLYLVVEGET